MTGENWPCATSDGLIIRVQAAESGLPPAVQFGDDAPIALPAYGMYPVAGKTGPYVLMQCVDDRARSVTRAGIVLGQGPVFGTDAVMVSDRGLDYIVYAAEWIDGESEVIPHPAPGGQGIAEIDESGDVIPFDHRLVGEVHGRKVCRWSTSGRYTVAQDGQTGYGILHNGAEWLLAIAVPLKVAPRVVEQADGSAIVTCFPGYVVRSSECVPLTETPLPPLSAVPHMGRPFAVCVYSFAEAPPLPGAITIPVWHSSSAHYTASVPKALAFEDRADLVADESLWGILADEHGPDGRPARTAEDAIIAARPVAHARNRGLVVYQDGQGLRPYMIINLKPGDVISSMAFRNKGESIGGYRARMSFEIPLQSEHAPYMPCLGLHDRGGILSTREIVEALITALELARDFNLPGVLLFAAGRAGVPAEVWPYVARLLEGCQPAPALVPPAMPKPPVSRPPAKPEPPVVPSMPVDTFPRAAKRIKEFA